MATNAAIHDDDWEEPLDDAPLSIPVQFRDINARELKLTVRDLFERYTSNRLVLQAEFQREYVWDATRASRFVESLILGLPVPPIFVAENDDDSWDVVDGHQRLESLFGFLQPLAAGPSERVIIRPNFRSLRLKDLEVLSELNGQDITALPTQSRQALWDRVITVMSIPRSANRDLRFVLFSRLNLGSVPLNPMELRNCIYRGPYNDLIRDLASEASTLEFFGRSRPHKRMKDRELVLRFFALLHGLAEYRTPFRSFLNDEMERNQNMDRASVLAARREWEKGILWTTRVFGQHRCRLFRLGTEQNPRGRWDTRWSDLIFEVETVTLSKAAEDLSSARYRGSPDELLQALRHDLVGVMCGANFLRALNEGTTRPENVNFRLSAWEGNASSFASYAQAKVEMFQEIKAMYFANALCPRCQMQVDSLEDAARLLGEDRVAHRYCYLRSLS